MLYNQVMMIPSKKQAIQTTAELLCEWLDCQLPSGKDLMVEHLADSSVVIDARIELNQMKFLVEYKHSGKVSAVASGIRQLKEFNDNVGGAVKLLVVPFMHELGRKRCQEAGISWVDLSGNADVTGPGIRIYIQGKSSRFKQRGRPMNIFAPKSSRVARVLLYNLNSAFTQRELAEITGLDEGYVSRIVHSLEEQELIERRGSGEVSVKETELMLETWSESYDFAKHTILRGHVPARSGSSLLEELSNSLLNEDIKYAATGLGAAWQYTHFAAFRTASIFIDKPLDSGTLSKLDFRESDSGSNTWFIFPNDESIFWEAKEVEGVQCVHPIQAYLDLKAHPERAEEAMSELKRLILELQIVDETNASL
jgi:hypothetical protein